MAMAKKSPRFKTKLDADAYHFLLEETDDKKDYELGNRMYSMVYVSYYNCYVYVHCVLYSDDKAEDIITFATKSGGHEFVHVKTKLFGGSRQ